MFEYVAKHWITWFHKADFLGALAHFWSHHRLSRLFGKTLIYHFTIFTSAQVYLVCQTNISFSTPADCDRQTSQLHLITVWNQEHSDPSRPATPTPIKITAATSSTTTTSRARWLFRSPRVLARREQCGWSLSQYCGTAHSCSRQLVAAAQSRGGVQQLRQLSPRQPVSKQRRKVRACSGGYRFARKGLCPMFFPE